MQRTESSAPMRRIRPTPSIARLIGIGLMCIHNPCDEIGRRVMDGPLRTKLKPNPRVRDAITRYAHPGIPGG